MKKQIIISLLSCMCLESFSQNAVKTISPCNDAVAQNASGKWIKTADIGTINSKEAYSRLDEIKNLLLKIYPEPKGVDAAWHRAAGISYFGSKRKYSTRGDGSITFDYLNLPHFIKYYFNVGFFAYSCDAYEKSVLRPGHPGETGTWFSVTANETQATISEAATDDGWTINGLPVRMRPPVLKKIGGYDIQYPGPGYNSRFVLVHRNGILPYIPVSRKQYLERCIIYHTKLWGNLINLVEQKQVRSVDEQEKEKKAKLDKFQKDFGNDPKKLKANVDYYLSGYKTDQQIRDEELTKTKKIKDQELKKFKNELTKTTNEGLLDIPAMILQMYLGDPVFETDTLKAHMVVIENPEYIRKDLPKHIPQVFVVYWVCDDRISQKRIGELIEEKFPFEKLQAMIDK
jgi:hypothetical protein